LQHAFFPLSLPFPEPKRSFPDAVLRGLAWLTQPALRSNIRDSRRLPRRPNSVQHDNKSTTIPRSKPAYRTACAGLHMDFPTLRAPSRERDNREPRGRLPAVDVTHNIARS
jgi:hypothetical protein